MSRDDKHARQRGPGKQRSNGGPDGEQVTLREMRFDTPEASATFFTLRFLYPAFAASRDSGVRLPPSTESASATPASGGMVYRAYPHGLMFGDQMSVLAGGGLFLGLILAFMFAKPLLFGGDSLFLGLFTTLREGGAIDIGAQILFFGSIIIFAPVAVLIVCADIIGYRFNTSVLFDRNGGKVHVLSDRSVPWSPWRHQLATYDWRCIRGEIDTVTLLTGPFLRQEAGLRCVVLDRPNGDTVIEQFVLGVNLPAHHVQPLLDTWEHVRLFMQRQGPLFANQHDVPNPSLGRQSLLSHLRAGPALQLRGTASMFKIAWAEKSVLALFTGIIGIVCLPLLPVTMLWGVLPWLSGLVKREPAWPAEILASVGGASLNANTLNAWRAVTPGQGGGDANASPGRIE